MILRLPWVISIASGIVATAPVLLVAQVDSAGSKLVSEQILTPGPDFVGTAKPAVPGAEEVIEDVPNAMFWARFQRGTINGWDYVIFPDGTAKVMQDTEQSTAEYTLTCSSGDSCLVERANGSSFNVPATGRLHPEPSKVTGGETLSIYLAEWILAETGTPLLETFIKSTPPGPRPPAPPTPATAPTAPKEAATPPALRTVAAPKAPSVSGGFQEPGQARPIIVVVEEEPVVEEVIEEEKVSVSQEIEETSCPELPGFVPNICDPIPAETKAPAAGETASTAANKTTNTSSSSTSSKPASGSTTETAAQKAAEEEKTLLERANLQCFLTGTFNLRYNDAEKGTSGPGKPRGNLGCSWKIRKDLTLALFFQEYLYPEQQEPWDPDFTFALTYKANDWLSLTYSNYLARFDGPNGEGKLEDSLTSGTLRANFKLPRYTLPHGETLACVAGIGLPKAYEERVTLSCGAGITKKLRVGGTAYLYFPGQQTTFSPDFSYTASYKISDKYRISYSNYSNNRWTFNKGDAAGPGFVGGSISFTYKLDF